MADCFIFCEKAESKACCGRIEEGEETEPEAGAATEDGGAKKGGGGKARGLKGNWGGRPRPARGE